MLHILRVVESGREEGKSTQKMNLKHFRKYKISLQIFFYLRLVATLKKTFKEGFSIENKNVFQFFFHIYFLCCEFTIDISFNNGVISTFIYMNL